MAYSSTNPVRKILDFGITGGGGIYVYESTHNSTDIAVTGFFAGCGFGSPTEGAAGMRVGDLLVNVNLGNGGISWHRVSEVSASSTAWGAPINASVSDGST